MARQNAAEESTEAKNHTVNTEDIQAFLEGHVDTFVFDVVENHVPGASDYNAVVGDLNSIPNFGVMPVSFDHMEPYTSENGNSLIRIHLKED